MRQGRQLRSFRLVENRSRKLQKVGPAEEGPEGGPLCRLSSSPFETARR
jgi:hypothetical protein